jgi:hypothetical protein
LKGEDCVYLVPLKGRVISRCEHFNNNLTRYKAGNILTKSANISFYRTLLPMLGGSLVTTAWRVLRLRMEGTASRYGG